MYIHPEQGDPIKNSMGFLAPEVNWMSWALSCLQLKKLYGEVELYTNALGKEVLIDRLNLPYTKVHMVLGEIKYEKQLWAFPKVYTYSLQEQPFIHIDGDVFMWEKMNHKLLNADLIAQNMETDNGFYDKIMTRLIESNTWFNESIQHHIQSKSSYAAYNAGIFGGHDIAFFKEYTNQAFELIDKNRDCFADIDLDKFNMIYEQYLFYCLSKERNKSVECYFPESVGEISTYEGFANFLEVPYQTKFIHMLGDYKRVEEVCVMLAKRLRQDYPEYYYRIIDECKKAGISPWFNCYSLYDINLKKFNLRSENLVLNQEAISQKSSFNYNWKDLYEVEKNQHIQMEQAFSSFSELFPAVFVKEKQIKIYVEETIQPDEDEIKAICQAPDCYKLGERQFPCDDLDLVLLELLTAPKTFEDLLHSLKDYFDEEEINSDPTTFYELISLRLKTGCSNNMYRIVKSSIDFSIN